MNLDELQSPMTSETLAAMLKKQHGIRIPVQRLSESQTHKMLGTVQNQIDRFRQTPSAHISERNRKYAAMLMVEQVLRSRLKELNESGVWDAAKRTARGVAHSAGVNVPYTDSHLAHSASEIGAGIKRIGQHLRKKDTTTDPDTTSAANTGPDDILAAIARAGHMETPKLKNILMQRELQPGQAQAIQQALQKILRKGITESRLLRESAMGEAEVILAAKDLADRVQDMVETVGKMVNEELPALTETIRDTMDTQRADAFNSSALESLNSALESVRKSKESLDNAARTLAGEVADVDTGDSEEFPDEEAGDLSGGDEEMGSDEDLLTAPAKTGKSQPLGRRTR